MPMDSAASAWPLLILVFVFGAAIGSFLNVVAYRWPRRESVASPPSHCMSCGVRLTVLDLFPVISYLALRGRCRHCGRRFSPRYMLVEFACGLCAAGSVYVHGLGLHALGVFACCGALLVALCVDLDWMILPDETTVLIGVVGVLFDATRLWQQGASAAIRYQEHIGSGEYTVLLPRSIVGLLMGYGLFALIGWVSQMVFRKPALGYGDVKLAAAMGTILGPGYAFGAYFLLSVLLGTAISLPLLLLGIRGRRDYIPFGPMMAAAGVLMLLFGETITPWVVARYSL
jgi:leader peptidase (prepilin peptidase)/N-methyltransferase